MYSSRGNNRGGQRGAATGRGRGRGWYAPASFVRQPPAPLPRPDMTQKHLQSIKQEDLFHNTSTKDTGISKVQNCQYVASYNWLDKKLPTIVVPGLPARWSPPVTNRQLQQDAGTYYRDPNAARFSTYPIDPAVRAIFALNPDFASSEVDVFGCGSTLGSLLSFAKNEDRTFRFGVERIGDTVFLVRKTNKPKEVIDDVRGHGHTFPDEYTTWDASVKNSASHQRIIRYDLGGLKCLVRSECDGFLPDKTSTMPVPEAISTDVNLTQQVDDLFVATNQPTNEDTLTMSRAGNMVLQESIFDLKTRAISKKEGFDLQELLPRLWINQTPNIVLGWHTRGLFHDIEIKDVHDHIGEWEEKNSATVTCLHLLLQILIKLTADPEQARFEVRRTEDGPLEIWSEVKEWSALPKDLRARWKGRKAGTSEENEHDQPEDADQNSVSDSESENEDYLKF